MVHDTRKTDKKVSAVWTIGRIEGKFAGMRFEISSEVLREKPDRLKGNRRQSHGVLESIRPDTETVRGLVRMAQNNHLARVKIKKKSHLSFYKLMKDIGSFCRGEVIQKGRARKGQKRGKILWVLTGGGQPWR